MEIDNTQATPARRFWKYLPFSAPEQILDLGLKETPLVKAGALAKWLNVGDCYLKMETLHPTGTVKDRITELLFSRFAKDDIRSYSHCSTGNTGTSLAWGLKKFERDFDLTIVIPEKQLVHHNFPKTERIRTILLKGANYDQGSAYAKRWREMEGKASVLDVSSDFRKNANKLPYLEAYEQLLASHAEPDYIVQACSSATGLIGGWRAAQDFAAQGLFSKTPGFVVAQPQTANPIVRCYKEGSETYDQAYTIREPAETFAWAIRRGNAGSCYEGVAAMMRSTEGFAVDASEEAIREAKEKVFELEGLDIGYTAAVSIAAIRSRNASLPDLSQKKVLFMITGKDRDTHVTPIIDEVLPESNWRALIEGSTRSLHAPAPYLIVK